MKRLLIIVILFGATSLLLSSCKTVEPWERMYLSDEQMSFKKRWSERYERSIETYREGASGGPAGKTGGGCGCN